MDAATKLEQLADDIRDSFIERGELVRVELARHGWRPTVAQEEWLAQVGQASARRTTYRPIESGAPSPHFRCPMCWLRDEVSSPLHVVSLPHNGGGEHEYFQCSRCGETYELPCP